jgi:hypothetical protein
MRRDPVIPISWHRSAYLSEMPGTRPGMTHSFDRCDRFHFFAGASFAGAAGVAASPGFFSSAVL